MGYLDELARTWKAIDEDQMSLGFTDGEEDG